MARGKQTVASGRDGVVLNQVGRQAHVEGALATHAVGFRNLIAGGAKRGADDGITPCAQNPEIF